MKREGGSTLISAKSVKFGSFKSLTEIFIKKKKKKKKTKSSSSLARVYDVV
jgi:hypothetical protein